MKRPTPTQFSAYQQIFDYFNQALFQGLLPDCMLSFSRRRSSSHTLYTSGQWQKDTGTVTPEISLNVKQLHENEPKEVMAILVREMVHLWQEQYGKSSGKGYFNRQWADKMEGIGLIPTATGLPGGKRTGKGIKHSIDPQGKFEQAFTKMPKAYLWPFRPTASEGGKRKGYSEKEMYCCPGCGVKVWGKGGLGLVCECGKAFVNSKGEAKPGMIEEVCRVLVLQCR